MPGKEDADARKGGLLPLTLSATGPNLHTSVGIRKSRQLANSLDFHEVFLGSLEPCLKVAFCVVAGGGGAGGWADFSAFETSSPEAVFKPDWGAASPAASSAPVAASSASPPPALPVAQEPSQLFDDLATRGSLLSKDLQQHVSCPSCDVDFRVVL